MKKFFITVGMLILLTIPLTIVTAGELAATPSQGIGNPINECQSATGILFDHGVKFEGSALSEGNTIAPVTIFNLGFDNSNDVTSLDWRSGTTGISVVIAKRGSSSSVFNYFGDERTSGSVPSDTHAISHMTFCWNDPADPPPSVSVTVGGCVFTGDTTTVTLTITGASVTITGPSGTVGTYSTTTTIQLPAGSYTYSYTALEGFSGSGSGSFSVNECPYASVNVNPLACEWDPVNEVSETDVELTIENASLTLTGPSGVVGTYTGSTTVQNLEPGQYSYTWIGQSGYQGSGSGTFTLIACEPSKAAADVSAGACVWDEDNGSLTEVTITLSNASLTINGVTYTQSTSIKLGPGSYPYEWEATGDAVGDGTGTLVVEDCTPETAEVKINFSACIWDENNNQSLTEVSFAITGATLTISGSSGQGTFGPYTESGSVTLPAGEYTYNWAAVEGFMGSGNGTFTLITCEPGEASASVVLGACAYIDGTSLTPVTLNLNHASLTINDVTYTESVTIELEPGEYKYTWKANEEGYIGEGSGSIVVDSCEPKEQAEAEITVGTCKWNGEESLTEVAFTLSGASLTITNSSDQTSYGPFTESDLVALPAGEYTYSWTAVEGFTGSGEGNFALITCEPGVASASVVLGSCGFVDGTSLTPVTISLNHASLTINGVTYTEGETIELEPGTYPYSWEANEEGYSGEGSGTITVDSCEPKEEPPVDPKPDVAAGGSGPLLIYIMAPATIGITSLGIAWTAIKKKLMDR